MNPADTKNRTLVFLLVAGVLALALGFGFYSRVKKSQERQAALEQAAKPFVETPTPTGQDTEVVLIVAALNCGREPARRADELARELEEREIPFRRINRVSFNLSPNADRAEMEAEAARLNEVMEGPPPIVFYKGKAKANPSLSQVLSEYGEE